MPKLSTLISIAPSWAKLSQANVAIRGDVREVLSQLIPQTKNARRSEWLQTVSELQREFPFATPGEDNPLMPYGLIKAAAAWRRR